MSASIQTILHSWKLHDYNLGGAVTTVIVQVSKNKKHWRATSNDVDPIQVNEFEQDFLSQREIEWWVPIDETYPRHSWEKVRLHLIDTLLPELTPSLPSLPPYNDLDRFIDLE